MGSMDLIEEAGGRLHEFAAELVPPLKKALDTREPTVVCLAVELMKTVIRTDPQVTRSPRDHHALGNLAINGWSHVLMLLQIQTCSNRNVKAFSF